jgi:hypothetical protein
MQYVYSTATCPISYVQYAPTSENESERRSRGGTSHNRVIKKVTINGGHGVANKVLFTPKGVVTQVSDDDFEFLMQNESFKTHMARGYMTVDKKKVEPEKRAKNMADKDGSAPLTPKDFEKGENDLPDLRVYKGLHVQNQSE